MKVYAGLPWYIAAGLCVTVEKALGERLAHSGIKLEALSITSLGAEDSCEKLRASR